MDIVGIRCKTKKIYARIPKFLAITGMYIFDKNVVKKTKT